MNVDRPSWSRYPFEWTGVYPVEPGRYELSLAEGPDPAMSLVIIADQDSDDTALRDGAEFCVRRYADAALSVFPDSEIPFGSHVDLQLQASGRKSFFINVEKTTKVGLYAQHTAEEFDMNLINTTNGQVVPAEVERTWVAQHEHDDEVGSIAIERNGSLDPEKLNAWLSTLLREKGVDLFRMKGFLSLDGAPERYVFQGVHMLFSSHPDRPWGDMPRHNRLYSSVVIWMKKQCAESLMNVWFKSTRSKGLLRLIGHPLLKIM